MRGVRLHSRIITITVTKQLGEISPSNESYDLQYVLIVNYIYLSWLPIVHILYGLWSNERNKIVFKDINIINDQT